MIPSSDSAGESYDGARFSWTISDVSALLLKNATVERPLRNRRLSSRLNWIPMGPSAIPTFLAVLVAELPGGGVLLTWRRMCR